jgi:hypothetical protein
VLVTASVLAAVGGLLGPSTSAAPATRACTPRIDFGVPPAWARAGFSDPKPRIPHVLGSNGEIVAILFGYPLVSPPASRRANKILWVSRRPAPSVALYIRAQRMVGTQRVGPPVERIVRGGPGPSIVDLPMAGCWRLSLHWSGGSDTVDLRYRTPGSDRRTLSRRERRSPA